MQIFLHWFLNSHYIPSVRLFWILFSHLLELCLVCSWSEIFFIFNVEKYSPLSLSPSIQNITVCGHHRSFNIDSASLFFNGFSTAIACTLFSYNMYEVHPKSSWKMQKTFFKLLEGVNPTIAAVAVATAFRVLHCWRQQCNQTSDGCLEKFLKN